MTVDLQYDAFVSFNSKDRLPVEDLAERLRAERLKLFFSETDIVGGRHFVSELGDALMNSKSVLAFLGPNGVPTWQDQELQVAIDRKVTDSSFHVIPVLLPGARRPRRGEMAHLAFINNASWVAFSKTTHDSRAFQKLVTAIKGQTARFQPNAEQLKQLGGRCPYCGLNAFEPKNAEFFFGRDNVVDDIVAELCRKVESSHEARFLAVLGPSGIGKSSIVRSGVVPRLQEDGLDGSGDWPMAIMRHGNDPLQNLSNAVVKCASTEIDRSAAAKADEAATLVESLRARKNALHSFAEMALANRPSDTMLLVVVDQFEEAFSLRPESADLRGQFDRDREALFANLLYAAGLTGGKVVVVLTMRSDFLSQCADFPQLNDVLTAHMLQIREMNRDELREAIENPAFLVGCELEPGLTERLLTDVAGQKAALPLLEYTLTELWRQRSVRRLTLKAYDDLGRTSGPGETRQFGGIGGALERRADEFYNSFSEDERAACRRVFLRLIQVEEGVADTRRRVPLQELMPDDALRAAIARRVVDRLTAADCRLLTTDDEDREATVEIVHEALIDGWKRLRDWIDQDRVGLRIHRRLTEAAREWASAPRPQKRAHVYTGANLAIATEWATTRVEDLSGDEQAFLAASQHELRRRIRRKFIANALLVALTVACVIATCFAHDAKYQAVAEQKRAEVKEHDANVAKAQAEAAKAQAEEEYTRAKNAVDDLYIETADDESLPVDVRARLLKPAFEYYTQFLIDHADDPTLKPELARIHFRKGRIAQLGGQTDLAEQEYGDALKYQESKGNDALKTTAPSPDSIAALRDAANTLNAKGTLHADLGQLNEAKDALNLAMKYREHWTNLDANDCEAKRRLANTKKNLAIVVLDDRANATKLANEAIGVYQELIGTNPDTNLALIDVASGHYDLAYIQIQLKSFDDAKASLVKAREAIECVGEPASYGAECLRVQSVTLALQAQLSSNPSDALALYKRALPFAEKLVAQYPYSPDYLVDTARVYEGLGTKPGTHFAEAIFVNRRAMELVTQAVELNRSRDRYMLAMVEVIADTARCEPNIRPNYKLDDVENAIAFYRTKLTSNSTLGQMSLKVTALQYAKGLALARQRDYADAITEFDQVRTQYEQSIGRSLHPMNTLPARSHVESCCRILAFIAGDTALAFWNSARADGKSEAIRVLGEYKRRWASEVAMSREGLAAVDRNCRTLVSELEKKKQENVRLDDADERNLKDLQTLLGLPATTQN